ncbi:MAG TPA: HsdR family type I site-specific deoxyribonuclease [Pseudobacteroides sp.]|uniref:type I restriction endonuclease subunit R n=1 Tax=Pseudobacteroides sp. TaxID=1968840 RepID=UPI002F954AAF
MPNVGQIERETQKRIIALFKNELKYTYLGNWEERLDNKNIEDGLLTAYLAKRGYTRNQIERAVHELQHTSTNYNEDLYNRNKKVYSLLRYGVKVKVGVGENYETVHLIDWDHPLENDFYIAEEVTVIEEKEKRPDVVLYINGIAIGVLELKRSTVSIGDGIRQSIRNQNKDFIEKFFSTVQFVFAGNDTEGLRYGTIGTPEKFFLTWKEDIEDDSRLQLDKYLIKMCNKERIIEIMHNFILFDAGMKKLPRVHQYFGIKAAQEHVKRYEGGIIWHTQGSGKSIVMVLLAKWILENKPNARVVVITDRDELDKQIERVFTDVGEKDIIRTSSGRDLMLQLSKTSPRLLCSLVHKFGKRDVDNFERFIKELESQPAHAVGELFLFIDECHRTQSGKLHRTMKAMLPNAVFIGFTGTPLLKKDKATSLEVFGKYIHTYKFNEAVEDKVILDLMYDARDIDQKLTSPAKVDEWFEIKTRGLNDFQKAELRKKWGTMQKILSARSRMEKIVADIVFDFSTKPRINSGSGNAILVASEIYEACRYYELFQKTDFKGKCAIVTSYNPSTKDITTEDTGSNTETEKEYIYNTYKELLKDVVPKPKKTKTETYEDNVKEKFLKEPANMKLIIVVNKLLTGFDAPSCTYIYIDKSMQDHGLFQAICRVNRLDSDDKQFGYVVDYKDLFRKVEKAVAVYTAELDYDEFEKADCDILLKNRIEQGRERLDEAIEHLDFLCEPVMPPKDTFQYMRYFCGNPEIPEDLKAREVQRMALYKGIVALIRAYANIADDMEAAGYTEKEIMDIKKLIDFYLKLREEIKMASHETTDFKTYEADMRYLIDSYIQAEDPRNISPFTEMSLIEIIVKTGIADAINSLSENMKSNKEAVAEAIENNVRSKIIKDHLIDPAYFDEMSTLLKAVIKERKDNAISYEEYLKKIAELARNVQQGKTDSTPKSLNTPAKRALFNNLGKNEELAIAVHNTVMESKPDGWRGENTAKKQVIKSALYQVLQDQNEVERIFSIVEQQNEY